MQAPNPPPDGPADPDRFPADAFPFAGAFAGGGAFPLAAGDAFPLASGLEFAPLPMAVACARLHAVNVLNEWALPRALIDDAELLVSELMTNALTASVRLDDRPPIAVRLLADAERLVIEVCDQSPYDLVPFGTDDDAEGASGGGPEDDAEGGRGLMIVAALSRRWGSRRVGYRRKIVWAELDLRS